MKIQKIVQIALIDEGVDSPLLFTFPHKPAIESMYVRDVCVQIYYTSGKDRIGKQIV